MIVTGSRVLDKNEVEMYPIDFKAPMTIELNAINNGEVVRQNLCICDHNCIFIVIHGKFTTFLNFFF